MLLYLQLFWIYIKIGLFGFGGGYAMLSLIQDEVVVKYGWITAQEFTDIVAVSQVTPGPIGINSATYIGYTVTGSIWGALVATFAVSLPSFLLVMLISFFFNRFRYNRYVDAVFRGVRPASVGLIASAALLLALQPGTFHILLQRTLPSSLKDFFVMENFADWSSLLIFSGVFYCSVKKLLHPILLVVLSGIAGLILY